MTRDALTEWLAGRTPARPPALAQRMDAAVAATSEADLNKAPSLAHALGAVGLAMLADVTRRDPQAEGVALDLLAADAFVTYAFEAAAEQGEPVEPLARTLIAEAAR